MPKGETPFTSFSYDQLNQFEVGFTIFFVGIISLLIVVVGLAIILNYLSNLRNNKGKIL